MDDNKLLELSAKAYRIELEYRHGSDAYYYDDPESGREQWDPLNCDAQALRLAVVMGRMERLGVAIHIVEPYDGDTGPYTYVDAERFGEHTQYHHADPFAATRRAIVLAAARIGEFM